jgi:hypothetical protein
MSATLARAVSVSALIIGPLSLIVTSVTQWLLQPTGHQPWDAATEYPAAWIVIALLAVLGPLVWIAGLPAIVALAPARGGVVTLVGALLTGAGLAAGIGHLALFFGLYGAIAESGAPDHAASQVAAAGDADVLANVLLIVFLICFSLGPIVLTVGLRMARVVAVWVPIAAIVTAGANLFGGPIAGVVQLVTLVLVWAPLVVAVARPRAEVAQPALAI